MDNSTGMDENKGYGYEDHDEEEVEEQQLDWDAENDYRDDLREANGDDFWTD